MSKTAKLLNLMNTVMNEVKQPSSIMAPQLINEKRIHASRMKLDDTNTITITNTITNTNI